MININIETPRLVIRPFRLSDLESCYEMNLDAEVSKYTGDGGVISKKEMKRRIEEDVLGDYKKYGFGRLAVELKGEDDFIGFTGLKYLPELKTVDLGFRFKRKYWGQGIATESGIASVNYGFESLKLEKILGFVLPKNLGSIRVLEKIGFMYEKEIIEDGYLIKQYALNQTF